MQQVIISGVIGSGKTKFCSLSRHPAIFWGRIGGGKKYAGSPASILYISVDNIGKNFLKKFFQENLRWRKKINFSIFSRDTVHCVSTEKIFLKYLLFHSLPIEQKIFWKELENFSHPRIQKKIFEIQKKYSTKKGVIVWDCALPEKFFSDRVLENNHIKISLPQLYKHIFLLKKWRKISTQEIFYFLRKQKHQQK